MRKNRLAAGAIVAIALVATVVLAATAAAKPNKQAAPQARVKLGFITKFPVDFYFTLVERGEEVGEPHTGSERHLRAGKSGTDDAGEIAAIQNMVAQGVKGIAITPTSPAVSRRSTRR